MIIPEFRILWQPQNAELRRLKWFQFILGQLTILLEIINDLYVKGCRKIPHARGGN